MAGAASVDRDREIEMKRVSLIFICGLAFILPVFGDKARPTPEQQNSAHIEELKQKIAHDSEREICVHSAQLVRDLVEQFNTEINTGQLQPAQQSLDQIGSYADKAREAASKSHHKLKEAELVLHKSARRLSDIAQAMSVEDRPAIMLIVKRIEAADDALLREVFKD
jgi:hypothetical protein